MFYEIWTGTADHSAEAVEQVAERSQHLSVMSEEVFESIDQFTEG